METDIWFDSLENFIEIVDQLPTNEFAGVPPIDSSISSYNLPLQQIKIKTRNAAPESPAQSPNSRVGVNVKELLQRIEQLEETVHQQNTILHDLFSYINSKLTIVEKSINKSN
jgi:hypothetical protein